MIFNLKRHLRRLRHDGYYLKAGKGRIEFALKCQDVATAIDLKAAPSGAAGSFRLWFHLSVCQACADYADTDRALSHALRESRKVAAPVVDLKALNAALIKRFASK